jgi:meso-butanediol dehydrogenase/(S,S)-butanediol dehydrogenase/diacetyl reductase
LWCLTRGEAIQSVIVTGAGSGIGAAVALRIAADDTHVICVDVDAASAESTAARLGESGKAATAVQADVSSADACARVAAAAADLPPLTGLCNIAGIYLHDTALMTTTEAQWDLMLAVNLKSVFLMSKACIPLLSAHGAPTTIINTASVHAYGSHPESAPYAASKGAVVALTRQMAIDLVSYRIRVVAVAPGSVNTPMGQPRPTPVGETPEPLRYPDDPLAIGRLGQPEEVAELFAWLLSPQASFVNGTTVVVDGGMLAQLP